MAFRPSSRRTRMFSRIYPSIDFVLAQNGYIPEVVHLPPQRRYQYQHYPYSQAQSSRYERDDVMMRTIDTRFEASTIMPAIREEPYDEAPANLHEALHPIIDGYSRASRTTAIIDFVLVVRRRLQKLAREKK